jgi:hypothetical protein
MLNVDWNEAPTIDTTLDQFGLREPRAIYPTSPFAAECQYYPVIRTIKSAIDNSDLKEDILSSTRVHLPVVDEGRELSFWHLSERVLRDGKWQACTPASKYSDGTPIEFINGTLGSYYLKDQYENGTWYLTSVYGDVSFATEEELMNWGNRSWYAEDCVWEVEAGAVTAIRNYFQDFFKSRYIYTMNETEISNYFGNVTVRRLYANGTANLTTVSSYASGLAESISGYIRIWGDNGNPVPIRGQAYSNETCIKVQWLWGVFPASLVPLALIFLSLTIRRTRNQGGQRSPWKSSSLPVLIHGLEGHVQHQDRKLEKKSEMEEISEEIKVRLVRRDNTWALKS